MDVDDLKLMKEKVGTVSDEKLISTISKGALGLSDGEINTVSFVFWLVYMAETDLEDIITEAWRMAGSAFSEDVKRLATEILQKQYSGSRTVDPNKLVYFIDKIVVLEALYGKDARVKMLYKLNDLRNALSHNRIGALSYGGMLLSNRPAKEKILIDYFEMLTAKYEALNKDGK